MLICKVLTFEVLRMDEGEDDADREKQNSPSLSEGGK